MRGKNIKNAINRYLNFFWVFWTISQFFCSQELFAKKVNSSTLFFVIENEKYGSSVLPPNLPLLPILLILLLLVLFLSSTLFLIQRNKLNQEIAQLKKQNQKIKYHEIIVNHADDIIVLCDTNFNILEANNKAIQAFSLYDKPYVGKKFFDFIQTKDVNLLDTFKDCFEVQIISDYKSPFFGELSLNEITKGNEKLFVCIIRDITDRKVLIEKISRLKDLLTSLLKINNIILHKYELTEIFQKTCESLVKDAKFTSAVFFRYIPEEDYFYLIAKYGTEIPTLTESDFPMSVAERDIPFLYDSIIQETNLFCNDLSQIESSGIIYQKLKNLGVSSYYTIPIFFKKNVFGVFILFSDLKNFFDKDIIKTLNSFVSEIEFCIYDFYEEQKSFESEFKKRLFFEKSPNGFLITDLDYKIIDANQSYLNLVEKKREEVIGQELFKIISSLSSKELNGLSTKIEPATNFSKAIKIFNKSGQEKWVQCICEQVIEYNFLLFVFTDITELKNTQKNLEIEKERAEASSRLKTHILQNISHEFRTPLSSILGFSKIIKDTFDDTDLQDFANAIYTSGHRLYKTLESLILTSQLVAGSLVIKPKEIYLPIFLDNLSKEFTPFAKEKNIEFIIKYSGVENPIKFDSELLSTLLHILIDNALKFTTKGSITVEAEIIEENGKRGLNIKIEDTGIGIQPEKFDKIFDLFIQGSEGIARDAEGLGVGLFNAKKIIELLGGKISFESKLGEGTKFFIYLPENNGQHIATNS
ncbi:MAG: ATP-binding protein [Ignavibacteria bacterium]|nr:ATP-binding protein [Ignavibacteria bacterium]